MIGGKEPFQVCYLGLKRNLIFVIKMSDAGVHTIFRKDSCNMVRGVMVLMKGVQIGTVYKMLGYVDSIRFKNIISSETDLTVTQIDLMSTQINLNLTKSAQNNSKRNDEIDLTRLWNERMGHIR
jgi:hypothetical protein